MKVSNYWRIVLVFILAGFLWSCNPATVNNNAVPPIPPTQEGIEIKDYRIGWYSSRNFGIVNLKLVDGKEKTFKVTSIAELAGWSAVLEHKPAFLGPEEQIFTEVRAPQSEPK